MDFSQLPRYCGLPDTPAAPGEDRSEPDPWAAAWLALLLFPLVILISAILAAGIFRMMPLPIPL